MTKPCDQVVAKVAVLGPRSAHENGLAPVASGQPTDFVNVNWFTFGH